MPFDVLERPKLSSLSDVLTHLGIVPVSMKVLEAHKKAQVRAHPPSLLNNPLFYAGLYLAESVVLFVTDTIPSDLLGFSTSVLSALTFGIFTMMVSYLLITFAATLLHTRVRTKARWREDVWPSAPAPEAIREMLEAVKKLAPWTTVLYGELTQSNVLLDPYVIVQWTRRNGDNTFAHERHCLGIWDGEQIIALADWQRN